MCFSVEIVRDLKSLAKEFSAKIDKSAFERLNKNCELDPKKYKVPGDDNRIFPNIYSPILIKPSMDRIIYRCPKPIQIYLLNLGPGLRLLHRRFNFLQVLAYS